MDDVTLLLGDAVERMREIDDASVDAIICDPPYPEIDRPYGRMTEAEWDAMMRRLIPECRRVLKPSGSAVFILQPNSERVGRMRPWLWEFMAWTTREWGMVQDAWWWNITAIPEAHAIQGRLMRPSVKACVWLGSSDCYRDQDQILWDESDRNRSLRMAGRSRNFKNPSGHHQNEATIFSASVKRGGVLPFNVVMAGSGRMGGQAGHPASTPYNLADYWVRYISPPGGVVLDCFAGSGTIPLAALARGRKAIAVERDPGYFDTMTRRIDEARAAAPLFR